MPTVHDRNAVIKSLEPYAQRVILEKFDNAKLLMLVKEVDLTEGTDLYDKLLETEALGMSDTERLETITGMEWLTDGWKSYEAFHGRDVVLSVWYPRGKGVWRANWAEAYETQHPYLSDTFERETLEDVVVAMFEDYGTAPNDEILKLLGRDVDAPVESRLAAYDKIADLVGADPQDPNAVVAAIEALD